MHKEIKLKLGALDKVLLFQLNIFDILLSTHLLICPSIHLCMCVGSLLGTNNIEIISSFHP